MRHTVRGILLNKQRVLLVTGHGADFYWTPGGGVELGESIVDTLHREIKEELGVTIKDYTPYYSYEYEDHPFFCPPVLSPAWMGLAFSHPGLPLSSWIRPQLAHTPQTGLV